MKYLVFSNATKLHEFFERTGLITSAGGSVVLALYSSHALKAAEIWRTPGGDYQSARPRLYRPDSEYQMGHRYHPYSHARRLALFGRRVLVSRQVIGWSMHPKLGRDRVLQGVLMAVCNAGVRSRCSSIPTAARSTPPRSFKSSCRPMGLSVT